MNTRATYDYYIKKKKYVSNKDICTCNTDFPPFNNSQLMYASNRIIINFSQFVTNEGSLSYQERPALLVTNQTIAYYVLEFYASHTF